MIEVKSIIEKIEYFKNSNIGTNVYYNNKLLNYKYSAKHFLNKICLINFTSVNSYNKSLNLIFNYKYLNPICFNNITLIQLGNINSYETIWINYENIKSINKLNNKTKVTFHSKNTLIVNKNMKYINNQIVKISTIKRYLCKL